MDSGVSLLLVLEMKHKRFRSKDLTGQKYGLWTVLERVYTYGRVTWKCRCECGAEKVITADNLVRGLSKSCGKGHGLNRDQCLEYKAFQSMKQRCTNPRADEYENYGGRGISICYEWLNDFDAFITYVGQRPSPNHSIDRIDNDGNYEPGNVRWATRAEQQLNRRVCLGLLRLNSDGEEEPISLQSIASYLAMSYSALRTNLINADILRPEPRRIGSRHV